MIISMTFLCLLMFFALISHVLPKLLFLVVLLLVIGGFIYFMWRHYDKLLIKYSRTFKISDDYFEFGNRKHSWSEVDWHKTETNSAIMKGFIVGIKGTSALKFFVTNKKSDEQNDWQNMRDEFLQTLSLKNIPVRNYYDSLFWRVFVWLIIASNIVVPLALMAFGFDFIKILPALLFWTGTSQTTTVVILGNQKSKTNNRKAT